MAERIERLRHALEELEGELQGLDTLDTETREILHRAAADIAAALNRAKQSLETQHAAETTTQPSFRDRVAEFDASHPHIAALLNRVIDLLGQAGI